jgi:hypothetical protein
MGVKGRSMVEAIAPDDHAETGTIKPYWRKHNMADKAGGIIL